MADSQHAEQATAFQHILSYANVRGRGKRVPVWLVCGNPSISQRLYQQRDGEGSVWAVMLMLQGGGLTRQQVLQSQYHISMHKEPISADKVEVKESMCRTLLRACGNG